VLSGADRLTADSRSREQYFSELGQELAEQFRGRVVVEPARARGRLPDRVQLVQNRKASKTQARVLGRLPIRARRPGPENAQPSWDGDSLLFELGGPEVGGGRRVDPTLDGCARQLVAGAGVANVRRMHGERPGATTAKKNRDRVAVHP